MAKITIDDLAGMMNSSFEHLEKKFDKRFDTLEKIVGSHERRLSHVEDDVRILKTDGGK